MSIENKMNWEEEFDSKFTVGDLAFQKPEKIKTFIRQLLISELEGLADEIVKVYKKIPRITVFNALDIINAREVEINIHIK